MQQAFHPSPAYEQVPDASGAGDGGQGKGPFLEVIARTSRHMRGAFQNGRNRFIQVFPVSGSDG